MRMPGVYGVRGGPGGETFETIMKEVKGPIGCQDSPHEPWAFQYLVGNENCVMLIASCSSVGTTLR